MKVASQCNQNPKKFWKYVNSKRKLKSSIGGLKTVDIHGNTRLITKDEEKANALGNFFSIVFTDEMNTQAPVRYDTFSSTSINNIEIDEQIILNKLNKLDVSKSPGTDILHPCILYELQNEIALLLKILYQTSSKLTTLPLDWTSGLGTKPPRLSANRHKGNVLQQTTWIGFGDGQDVQLAFSVHYCFCIQELNYATYRPKA